MRLCLIGDDFVNGTDDAEGLGWRGRVTAAAVIAGLHMTAYDLGIRRNRLGMPFLPVLDMLRHDAWTRGARDGHGTHPSASRSLIQHGWAAQICEDMKAAPRRVG